MNDVATEITADQVRARLPERPADGHKGTFGHALIIAGSKRYAGAPKLCVLGALRSGVGLATVGIPESIRIPVQAGLLEGIALPLPCLESGALGADAVAPALAADGDALGLGPGLGQEDGTRRFVAALLEEDARPACVDADALNLIAAAGAHALLKGRVATPHPGEMARLAQTTAAAVQADRAAAALEFAAAHQCVLVLKGARTLIAAPGGGLWANTTGNSGMASGGSGDVLTGLIAGLLAQGMAPLDAALAGAYLHGLAGDLAARRKTERGMLAGDIAEALPDAWYELERMR